MKGRSVDAGYHRDFILANLGRFEAVRLLVIGDVGIDEYVSGEVRRISPEAPVPVVEVEKEDRRLGLSANVAQNITSLGGKCTLISVVGEDAASQTLRGLLKAEGVSDDSLIVDRSRPTTRKLRVMSGHHHVVRVDYEHKRYLSAEVERELLTQVDRVLPECHGLILQDYAKGVLSVHMMQELIKRAHAKGKRVLLDPHRTTPLNFYRGVDILTPNYDESLALAGVESDSFADDEEILSEVARKLMSGTGAAHLVITLGKRGMRLIEHDSTATLPTFARQVFDVTGAGDTVIAMLALAWLSGFTLEQACVAANYAAGVVVGKVGCVPCTLAELREYI